MGYEISIVMVVYNTAKYLCQCIDSVISQTFTDFEFIIIDNGSTDGSAEIIHNYAERDARIRVLSYETNDIARFYKLVGTIENGKYITRIDSDDWWDLNYLERLIGFVKKNDLDIAITGTINYFQQNGSEAVLRKLETPLVLTRKQFAQYYPYLWTFPSTNWGNIMKLELAQRADIEEIRTQKLPYGADTLRMLKHLSICSRIGIDNSAMYHYRIHPASVSFQYDPRRFDSYCLNYKAIQDYLEQHNTFDAEKKEWLKRVHINSMIATLDILHKSGVSTGEKLIECLRVVEHPLTAQVLSAECTERETWYHLVQMIVSQAVGNAHTDCEENQIRSILQFISPNCANAFALEYKTLYTTEPTFWTALMRDEHENAQSIVMDWIAQGKYSKQFNLGELINSLIPDGFLLKNEVDKRFFRTYSESCRLILNNSLEDALEQMTGTLLDSETLYAEERFLQLYLSLAALQNQVAAFFYGNVRLASFYFHERRFEECRAVLRDIDEMGAGEHEDVLALRRALENIF